MKITAEQDGNALAVEQRNQERAVATGISWGAGEIRGTAFIAGRPIRITCTTSEKQRVTLHARVYLVDYSCAE